MAVNNLPSVTEVLRPFVDYSRVRPEILDHAARRGSRVHRACLTEARGRWAPPLLEGERGYFESFLIWIKNTVEEVCEVEPEWTDDVLGFVGHPDLVVVIKGDRGITVVDLKTPTELKRVWGCQLGAYGRLAEIHGYREIERVGSLRLRKHGGLPTFDHFKDWRMAFNAFLGALTAERYIYG